MDWSDATWWWVLAGVMVAAELATGTFYLLLMAIGAVAAALAAHAGASMALQLLVAALVGGGTTLAWKLKRKRGPQRPAIGADRNVNLDVGERVQVTHWRGDGLADVSYRGANWRARYAGSDTPQPGWHVIRAIDGNTLLLDADA